MFETFKVTFQRPDLKSLDFTCNKMPKEEINIVAKSEHDAGVRLREEISGVNVIGCSRKYRTLEDQLNDACGDEEPAIKETLPEPTLEEWLDNYGKAK